MFSRSKSGPPGGGKGATFSFIGPEVVITGDVVSPGQLHIDGKVIGDVDCGSLSQGESGSITGNIKAGEATLAGLIDGAVSAGTLLLETSSRITGDVLYETLTVSTGAQVDGRFKRRHGESDGTRNARVSALPVSEPTRTEAAAPASLFAGASEEAVEAAE